MLLVRISTQKGVKIMKKCLTLPYKDPACRCGRYGGVGHIFTCAEANFHPNVKPFEMGASWIVMKRSLFLFDHRMCES